MTVRDACVKGTKLLERQGIPEAALDAWYLLEHITGISRARYLSDGGQALEEALEARYFALIEKRGRRIPLQHLTGVQEFMGYSFLVSRHVLIPRQDTETLVEEALSVLKKEAGPLRVLDMCTGSGCILLSVLKWMCQEQGYVIESRKDFDPVAGQAVSSGEGGLSICGVGADISAPALEVAAGNAKRLGGEAEFCQGDLFENVKGRFSMILSNPPYIRTSEIETLQEEVRLHDPISALDGGADGLDFYRRIIRESREYLLPKGHLMFEIGYDEAGAVAEWMKEAGFGNISVKKDLAGLDRVISGVYQ